MNLTPHQEDQNGQTNQTDRVPMDILKPDENENNMLLPENPSITGQSLNINDVTNPNSSLKRMTTLCTIDEFTARRRGKRPEDRQLSRKVRRFYKKQDQLISAFENAHLLHNQTSVENADVKNITEDNDVSDEKRAKIKYRRVSLFTKISLIVNICLLISKLVAAYFSQSLSVMSSVADSAVDLLSGTILYLATRAIKRRDPFMYPQGRTRLEPIAIVILSASMCTFSFQVILKSSTTLYEDINCTRNVLINASDCVHPINMGAESVAIMITTIVVKFFLMILCSRESNKTLEALAQDHRNDVLSNIVALLFGFIGSEARKGRAAFPLKLILMDPIGAIIISFYILCTWTSQALKETRKLSGHTAKPEFIQQITWIVFNHSTSILKIDTVRAIHIGTHFFVEVDIVLPEEMSLKEAHDIGEELQKKIERVPEVERAFVHLDYEFSHKASDEHKVV